MSHANQYPTSHKVYPPTNIGGSLPALTLGANGKTSKARPRTVYLSQKVGKWQEERLPMGKPELGVLVFFGGQPVKE